MTSVAQLPAYEAPGQADYSIGLPRTDRRDFQLRAILAPELFANTDKDNPPTPEQERAIAFRAAIAKLDPSAPQLEAHHARVLDLREITIPDGTLGIVDKSWLYLVVSPRHLLVVSQNPTDVTQKVEEPFSGGTLDLVNTSPFAAALVIVEVVNQRTAIILDGLGRQIQEIQNHDELTIDERRKKLTDLSGALRYVSLRLIDEEAAVDQLNIQVTEISLGTLSLSDQQLLRLAILNQKRHIGTLEKKIEILRDGIREAGDMLNVEINEAARKAAQAELEAQKAMNVTGLMIAFATGVLGPPTIALGYIQAFQIQGPEADSIFRQGTVAGIILGTLLKPAQWLLRKLQRNGHH